MAAVAAAFVAVGGLMGGVVGLVHAPSVADAVVLAAGAAVGLPSVVLGLLVVRRRPGNRVGALLVAVGAVPCLIFGREVYSAAAGRVSVIIRWEFDSTFILRNGDRLMPPS